MMHGGYDIMEQGSSCQAMTTTIAAQERAEDDAVRRLMAKVLVLAIKEATGMIKVSGRARLKAQEFLLTDWAHTWADYLGCIRELEWVCFGIVEGYY